MENQLEILKYLLGQIYRADEHRKRLEGRLREIRERMESPIGGMNYKPLPRVSGNGDGAAAILYVLDGIEERIIAQKEEINKAIMRVMDLLDYLPQNSLEREICEMHHIDMMPFKDIADKIPMSRSQVSRRYNKGLQMMIENKRVQKICQDHEEEYTSYVLSRGFKKPNGGA